MYSVAAAVVDHPRLYAEGGPKTDVNSCCERPAAHSLNMLKPLSTGQRAGRGNPPKQQCRLPV